MNEKMGFEQEVREDIFFALGFWAAKGDENNIKELKAIIVEMDKNFNDGFNEFIKDHGKIAGLVYWDGPPSWWR